MSRDDGDGYDDDGTASIALHLAQGRVGPGQVARPNFGRSIFGCILQLYLATFPHTRFNCWTFIDQDCHRLGETLQDTFAKMKEEIQTGRSVDVGNLLEK